MDMTVTNYLQNFVQYSCLKVNCICTGNYLDHQCAFRRNRSATDQIFCIRHIL